MSLFIWSCLGLSVGSIAFLAFFPSKMVMVLGTDACLYINMHRWMRMVFLHYASLAGKLKTIWTVCKDTKIHLQSYKHIAGIHIIDYCIGNSCLLVTIQRENCKRRDYVDLHTTTTSISDLHGWERIMKMHPKHIQNVHSPNIFQQAQWSSPHENQQT